MIFGVRFGTFSKIVCPLLSWLSAGQVRSGQNFPFPLCLKILGQLFSDRRVSSPHLPFRRLLSVFGCSRNVVCSAHYCLSSGECCLLSCPSEFSVVLCSSPLLFLPLHVFERSLKGVCPHLNVPYKFIVSLRVLSEICLCNSDFLNSISSCVKLNCNSSFCMYSISCNCNSSFCMYSISCA